MKEAELDTMALEHTAKTQFGVSLTVSKVIVQEVDVARAVKATVFLTSKKQLYCYIHGHSRLLLSDVRKLIARMGMKPELFLPPKGQPQYFEEIGKEKFQTVFPGRTRISSDDIAFYKTLAPYNPALALIGEVKNGEIYQFDSDAHGDWRVAARFAYRRIRTS